MHQTIEMANKKDILATISLLTEAIKGINKYDWSFK